MDDFRRHGSQTAIVAHRGNRRFRSTWAQVAELSARFAAELELRGLKSGDRVLIWGANGLEWVAAFFGCLLRGVVAVPLDAASGTEFALRVAKEVSPKAITGDAELLARLSSAIGSGTQSRSDASPEAGTKPDGEFPAPAVLPFHDFGRRLPAPQYAPVAGLSRETVLQIVFTSGTTAEPKGIVHTHGNVLASIDPLEKEIAKYLRYERLVHPLRILHTLPLSHVFGQFMGLWVPPLIAAEVHYESRLEAARLLEISHRERISVLAGVPRVLDLLRSHMVAEMPGLPQALSAARGQPLAKRWWRLRRLHRRLGWKFWAFVCGGAAVSPDLESFWTTAGFALIQGYGMTETTALVTLNHPFKNAKGSIGRPLSGREVQIGPEGEILVRGASIADRYWKHGRMEERPEGWLATGDLVTRDERGELVFAGRKNDVIVTSAGLNIHPQDLEAALRRQPEVRDALVVPFQSPSGPVPAAVLMAQPGAGALDADAAMSAANGELAGFQQMQYGAVWPQPDFPRTSTGKVLRRQVEKWAQQKFGEAPASQPGGQDSGADPLVEIIRSIQPSSRNRPISDSDQLAQDLHLDSLAMVQLESALESRFGAELEEGAWQAVRTVGDLRKLLHGGAVAPAAEPTGQGQTAGQAATPADLARLQAAGAGAPGEISQPVSAPPQPIPQALSRHRAEVFPRWPWWPPFRWIRTAFLELVMRPLVALLLAPRIEGGRTIARPSLLIANHVTALDPPILLYGLRARDRDHVAIAMAGEILSGWRRAKVQKHRAVALLTPAAYWLVTGLFNVFPLPRGRGLRRSFAHAGEALDRGYHVLVFPEGRRSPDGRLQPFESGIGLLAQESQVPVQPVYLEGLGPLKLRQGSWFRARTVVIRFGKALELGPEEKPAEFARRLQAAMEELAGGDTGS